MVKEHIRMLKQINKQVWWFKKFYVKYLPQYLDIKKIRWLKIYSINLSLLYNFYFKIQLYNKMFIKRYYLKYWKKKKNLFLQKYYIINIKKTRLNYFLSLIQFPKGNIICQVSCGLSYIRTKKFKKSKDTFDLIAKNFVKKCKLQNIKYIFGFRCFSKKIISKSFKFLKRKLCYIFWKESIIKIDSNIWFLKKISHNGIRLKKKRRV